MNRRSILGLLGIGSVAGPAVASEAINKYGHIKQSSSYSGELYLSPMSTKEQLNDLQSSYNKLIGNYEGCIADYISRELSDLRNGYSSINLNTLDPDIRCMKSFSETAKIRIQIERRAKRRYEDQKYSLEINIKDLLRFVK